MNIFVDVVVVIFAIVVVAADVDDTADVVDVADVVEADVVVVNLNCIKIFLAFIFYHMLSIIQEPKHNGGQVKPSVDLQTKKLTHSLTKNV